MDTEQAVARHYTRGILERAILDALAASGKDPDRLTPSDLSGVDEFHLGWRAATVELGRDLALTPDMELLEIGSGIGGPARYVAETHGCRVTGIDLTEEFVAVANTLTARCRLSDRVGFRQGSALALPFPDARFDRTMLIHVGMNIADKATLFAETRRVLRPGGLFAVYEVMRVEDGDIPYPMPWAATPDTSFVETPKTYRRLLEAAGFAIDAEHNRREMALELARQMRERAATPGAPPLGLHTLMGPAGPERMANVLATLQRGTIAPVELIARAA